MSMQHHHEKIMLQGKAGQLEALYQAGQADKPAIVVCHPHPVYGGTMRNKVVYWIARSFEDLGYSVLRFNFRGVEKSEGSWDEAKGEVDDVQTAIDWLQQKNPHAPLYLAGFSFGCYVGLQAARHDHRIQGMLAVAPAVSLWSFDFMQGDSRPLTIIQGTDDEIVPFTQTQAWANTLAHAQFHPIIGAGHFFPKHMQALTQLCTQQGDMFLSTASVSEDQHCMPCRSDAPLLTVAETDAFIAQHPDWSCIQDDGIQKLQRVYPFKNFKEALHFTQQIGALAEQENHHPLLCTAWGEVVVTWWTHSINGLHQNDVVMASQTDGLFQSMA